LNQNKKFKAHGKFLITGEYAVLNNVPALAVPLRLSQYLEVATRDDGAISWKSYNSNGALWYDLTTTVDHMFNDTIKDTDPITIKLRQILITAYELSSLTDLKGFDAVTTLDFDRHYGMGTSSTLISLISQWLGCDPYILQFKCFQGSGYDIACATANSSIVYNYNNAHPLISEVNFDPIIKNNIFFVYLNRKQDSRDAIASFDPRLLTTTIRQTLSSMPQQFINTSINLNELDNIIEEHETIIASLIGLVPIKKRLFSDYKGGIKSLGGWGGDFIMVTGDNEARKYFKDKGFDIIFEWEEIIL
jgi:mevalonate kinase